jgi:hypothetical protein
MGRNSVIKNECTIVQYGYADHLIALKEIEKQLIIALFNCIYDNFIMAL